MTSSVAARTARGRARNGGPDLAVRVQAEGVESLGDEELVALAIGDGAMAARTARRLLDRFGSLPALLRASLVELRVSGLATRAGLRLMATSELGRRAARAWPGEQWLIRTPSDAAEPLLDDMASLDREELRVLLLDTKNVVTARRTVYRGNLAGSSVRVGEVFRDAVRSCAAALVVVHNHPSGDPSPSAEDLRITAELWDAGRLLDIELLDHIVIGRGRWTSLRAVGALGAAQGAAMTRDTLPSAMSATNSSPS